MQIRKICGLTILTVWMFWLSSACAQDATASQNLIDDLEFKIEIGQHERLIKRRTAKGTTIAPFKTDGCSGGLSIGWAFISTTVPAIARRHGDRPPWEHCCIAHDRAYHRGGAPTGDAKASFEARHAADEALRQCVIKTGLDRQDELGATYGLSHDAIRRLYRSIADVMYRAVRLGGIPCSGLSWRWGFGWPQCD